MDAIFGYTDTPDETLDRSMGHALAHRGGERGGGIAWRDGTLRHGPRRSGPVNAGLAQDGGVGLALAGRPMGGPGRLDPAGLVASYHRLGLGLFERLSGAFVLAVMDGRADRRKLHLVRDGAGLRTLYWARLAGRLLFAVEPKAILAAPGFPRRLRPAGLAQYLAFSFVPEQGTMLEGLFELPAGHAATFDLDRPEAPPIFRRFFKFEADEPEPATWRAQEDQPGPWVERTRQTIQRAVARRLPPQGEPVAVLLSGGLDSSLVAAEVKAQHVGPVKTFSIHFGSEHHNELDFAHAVARRLGTEHEDVEVRPGRFAGHLDRIVWHLDEPIGDPITAPNFEMARRIADQGFQYVFNGEGGDPLFGGPKNLPMLLSHWYGTQRGERFRERAYLASYRRAYEAIAELFRPELLEQVDPERDLEAVLRPYFQAAKPASLLNKLMALNIRLKGAHLILPKVERMTAAFGLTPLSPLFDEELIRLSFQMPPRLKLRDGVEKWVLKRAYEADLPKEVIERPKSGMRVPVHAWFRGYLWGRPGEMRPYAAKILSDKAVRRAGWFRPQAVRELWRYRSDSGPGRFGLRLWMLMTIELWRRVVLQGRPPTDGSAPSRRAGLSSAPSRPSSRPGEAQPPRAATTS